MAIVNREVASDRNSPRGSAVGRNGGLDAVAMLGVSASWHVAASDDYDATQPIEGVRANHWGPATPERLGEIALKDCFVLAHDRFYNAPSGLFIADSKIKNNADAVLRYDFAYPGKSSGNTGEYL